MMEIGAAPKQAFGYQISRSSISLACTVFESVRNATDSIYHPEAMLAITLMPSVLDAFINEVSATCTAYKLDQEIYSISSKTENMSDTTLLNDESFLAIERIRDDWELNPYERYKELCKILAIQVPRPSYIKLITDLRNELIHFKSGLIPIISKPGTSGIGRMDYHQEYPACVNKLKTIKYNGQFIIWNEDVGQGASDYESTEWVNRISSIPMAHWVSTEVLKIINDILNSFPESRFKNYLWDKYKCSYEPSKNVFQWN